MASKLWVLLDVKGVNFDGRKEYIRRCVSEDDTVKLVREPENPFDRDAVLVRHRRRDMGYIPKEFAGIVSYAIRKGRCSKNTKVVLVGKGKDSFVMLLISIKPNPLEFAGIKSIYG